jgi:uncharacterized protein (DUF1330 family)
MRTQITLAMAMVTGITIGAAFIQSLHAQTKPQAYVVVAVQNITNPDVMKTVVQRASPEALAAAGGRYIVRTNNVIGVEGTPPQRLVIIAFDNVEKALAWENSPPAKEYAAMRAKAAESVAFIAEGVAN